MRTFGTVFDRRALLVGAAAASASLSSRSLAAAGAAEDAQFGGFKVGVQSFCWQRFPLKHALEDIQRNLGLHYVELFPGHAPLDSSPEKIEDIVRMCQDYNVRPIAIGVLKFSDDHSA